MASLGFGNSSSLPDSMKISSLFISLVPLLLLDVRHNITTSPPPLLSLYIYVFVIARYHYC